MNTIWSAEPLAGKERCTLTWVWQGKEMPKHPVSPPKRHLETPVLAVTQSQAPESSTFTVTSPSFVYLVWPQQSSSTVRHI